MKDFIKHAYAMKNAIDFFSTIDKESILMLYTELDYIYNLLVSLGVVSIYSKNDILKDFEITSDMGNNKFITVGDESKLININHLINEICKMYENV